MATAKQISARRFEGRVHGAGEAGQRQGFGVAALVELLLPDDVVGFWGELLKDGGSDALLNAFLGTAPCASNHLHIGQSTVRCGALVAWLWGSSEG